MSQNLINYYELLGVTPNATLDEIKIQRNRMLLAFHPDHNKSKSANEMTKKLNLAWETLSDPAKRREYDEALKTQPQAASYEEPTRERHRTRAKPTKARPTKYSKEYDFCFPVSNAKVVTAKAVSCISHRALSYPQTFETLPVLQDSEVTLHPLYLVVFDVHEDFFTSVGLIHSMHFDNQGLIFDASTGELLDAKVANFLGDINAISYEVNIDTSVRVADRPPFLNDDRFERRARSIIRFQSAEEVSYYGANNVRYTKTCSPKLGSIDIQGVYRGFYAEWYISLVVLSKRYRFRAIENSKENELLFLESELSTCRICGEEISRNILVCNSCGNFVHKAPLRRHGYRCQICRKYVCRMCTYWIRKGLLFKKYLCDNCARLNPNQSKIRQFKSDQSK